MKLAIIGCGKMGGAIARGLGEKHTLFLFSRDQEKVRLLEKEGVGRACQELGEAVQKAEGIILAVKPQDLPVISDQLKGKLSPSVVIFSVLAGASLSTLHRYLPGTTMIRMMLNMAIIEKEGAIALATDGSLSQEKKEILLHLFTPLGKVVWLKEEEMDPFTSLAGSGPAFVFALVEGMINAGIQMGFSRKKSQDIVYQMLKGSLARLEHTGESPSNLIEQIASPGGTTRAGLQRMEELHLKEGMIKTFIAAKERAQELNKHVK